MTIAGSDSGGGAGIQADLRTFAALGVHGTSAITAITAQNTLTVTAVAALEAEMVVAQIDAVTTDMNVIAAKTGMLARPATVAAVAARLAAEPCGPLVVDPVLVSSTGHLLMEEGGVEAYRRYLLPLATVATPNLREAALLAGRSLEEIVDVADMIELARAILELGPRFVLVKGGHYSDATARAQQAPDVLVGAQSVLVLEGERVNEQRPRNGLFDGRRDGGPPRSGSRRC
jgi:hydroxymethylpyrimidine/phosphomethylpyrimidine kinase